MSKPTEVFAIHGSNPETLAYAMAKYSRSALSMKDSISQISQQRAEEFLNTFYFQYGHKSIADLAHIPLAIENISLLAAIDVVDESKWDGQERSTRYQDFTKREYYVPTDMSPVETSLYHDTMNMLFDAYEKVFKSAVEHFEIEHPLPEGMELAAYNRTIRARAFDVARYLLPMGTLTSVGQITSARTLESQVSRMMGSPYAEVRELAESMKSAVTTKPVFDPNWQAIASLREGLNTIAPRYIAGPWHDHVTNLEQNVQHLFQDSVMAPTLVKYAEPSEYIRKMRIEAEALLSQLHFDRDVDVSSVKLWDADEYRREVLFIVGHLYEVSTQSWAALFDAVQSLGSTRKDKAIQRLLVHRGPHDEIHRGARGGELIFDIMSDIGSYRDMHRHRRAVHATQAYTPIHGFALPDPICTDYIREVYLEATRKVTHAFTIMRDLRRMNGTELGLEAYLLPLGTRHRYLMKMDPAELIYIAELRTGPAGHIAYRRIAWEMYRKGMERMPNLMEAIKDRVTDPDRLLDFFKR